jgi:hypothetical protein
MRTLFFGLFILSTSHVQAQNFRISGVVIDSNLRPLESAAVLLLKTNGSDSAVVARTQTDARGSFSFENALKTNTYTVRISFLGYETNFQNVINSVDDKPADLGGIQMQSLSIALSETVVRTLRDPIQVKGDTTEFAASAYRTETNATAEDLLKKVPGIEVEKDGTVKAQGEQVQQVLINGKKFFGKDPKLATQNIPAEAIERVQVYKKRTDQAEFSGVDDGNSEQTINIILKPNFYRGNFGNVTAGGGTTDFKNYDRYTVKGAWNRFSDKDQMSVLGMANNINQQGFSFDDYSTYTNQGRGSSGSMRGVENNTSGVPLNFGSNATGFTAQQSIGGNFNKTIAKKTDLNGSYFFNRSDRLNDRLVERQNFLPQGNFSTKTQSIQRVLNNNHRLNLTLDHRFDSLTSLRFTSSFSNTTNSDGTGSVSQNRRGGDTLRNESTSSRLSEGGGNTVSNNILLRRRFKKKGRSASLGFNYDFSETNTAIDFETLNGFYTSGLRTRLDTIDQTEDRFTRQHVLSPTISYTEPLTKTQFLEFNYSYRKVMNVSEREVFKLKNQEALFDSTLSNYFDNDFTYQRTGLTYRLSEKKLSGSVGLQFQHSILQGENTLRAGSGVNSRFENFLPSAQMSYSAKAGNSLNFSYNTSVREPSITQLQPLTDNTNPLNIYIGNPNLKPEYNHRISARLSRFEMKSGAGVFLNATYNYTANKITTAESIDASLARLRRPVNVRFGESFSTFLNYSRSFWMRRVRASVGGNGTLGRSLGFVNDLENTTQTQNWGLTSSLSFQQPDTFEVTVSYRPSISYTRYSLQKSLDRTIRNHTLTASTQVWLPWKLRIGADLNYFIWGGGQVGGVQRVPVLGASVSKYILSNKRGEIKLTMVDLLNRNVGINRTTDLNYIQDERTNSLGRYFLLTFTYAIKPNIGGSGRGMGEGRREMRGFPH